MRCLQRKCSKFMLTRETIFYSHSAISYKVSANVYPCCYHADFRCIINVRLIFHLLLALSNLSRSFHQSKIHFKKTIVLTRNDNISRKKCFWMNYAIFFFRYCSQHVTLLFKIKTWFNSSSFNYLLSLSWQIVYTSFVKNKKRHFQ